MLLLVCYLRHMLSLLLLLCHILHDPQRPSVAAKDPRELPAAVVSRPVL